MVIGVVGPLKFNSISNVDPFCAFVGVTSMINLGGYV